MKKLIEESKDVLKQCDLAESTAAYAKSLEKLAKDRQMKMLSKKDRDNLISIAKLLDREKKEEKEKVDEVTKLKPGKMDPRDAMGKIITGQIKKASLKVAGPGDRRQVYVQVYGKPSVMGAPPDSIYIDLDGYSGAVGIQDHMIKSTELKSDGTLEIRAK